MIRWAFEQYATGEYSLAGLTGALERQGLTTRQTSRWPQRPLSRSQLAAILRDPYYIGKVTFKGEIYPGRHEALISPELFERVQRVLDVRHHRNQRDCRHSHFLRGLMQCGRCCEAGRASQLIYSRPVNRAGRVYEYYTCTNRMDAGCGLPHLPVVEIEDALAREVATLRIPIEEVAALRQRVADSLEHQQATEQETKRRLKKELGRLDVKEERLLDLAADGGLVGKKLRKRLCDLQTRRAVVRQQLECTDEQLRREADTVLAYLDLLADPGRFYELASPVVKRKLLTAFYAQIWLDDDQRTLHPVAESREIVTRLHQAARHVEGGSLRSRSNVKLAKESENMADGVSSVEAAVGSGDVSLTPVTSTKTPPERNSEGVCSNKMSVVGYVPYPLNDSSFLIQPTLPELQRLAEVMGSLPTDAPAGVAAMIEVAEQLPTNASANAALMIEEAAQLAPHEAERDAVRVPNDVAVMSKPVIAAMDEYPCCVKSGRRDGASDSRRVRRRFLPEAIAQVVERYRAGATAAELGAEHGVSKNGMLKLLREQGVQIRAKSLPITVVTQAKRLHERGLSMRQVSEQLGVSRTALRRNFQKMGVGV